MNTQVSMELCKYLNPAQYAVICAKNKSLESQIGDWEHWSVWPHGADYNPESVTRAFFHNSSIIQLDVQFSPEGGPALNRPSQQFAHGPTTTGRF